jgi:hypothetical protein
MEYAQSKPLVWRYNNKFREEYDQVQNTHFIMATITDRNLAISHNHAAGTAKCVVTAKVNFTTFEFNQLSQGLRYRLKCTIKGDDVTNDPELYVFPVQKIFPDTNPSKTENVKFEITLGESKLDEDKNAEDEIYAQLVLTNDFTPVIVTRNTNIVKHWFPLGPVLVP